MSRLELENVVRFCRGLRDQGLAVTPAEVVTSLSAIQLIDQTDHNEVFLTLRSVLTSRPEDFPIFESFFESFWNRLPQEYGERNVPAAPGLRPGRQESKSHTKDLAYFLEHWTTSSNTTSSPLEVAVASDIESHAEKDFLHFRPDELQEIAQLARRIVRRLARTPGRRWRPVRRGRRINLRRSLRQSLKTGGELIELSHKERKPKRTKLLVLCDVSGSMDIYSRLLLQFVYGLQNSFAKVETFVFSTSLSRITGHLKNKTYERALKRLSANVEGWSGGTRIGASLLALNAEWLGQVDKRTIVIILSDGWDTGEPEQLVAALGQLKQRAGRLIWLNPLLGSSNYQPLTRGMQAALPLLNLFAPAHDLASLRALEPHLVL